MVKQFLPAVAVLILLASCSSLKPLNFTSNKQVMSAAVANPESTPQTASSNRNSPKFIETIAVTPETNTSAPASSKEEKQEVKETVQSRGLNIEEAPPSPGLFGNRSSAIESASPLQLKYSILLNTEVEQLQNKVLLESVDEWYGTRYRMGGTTKSGIDCSAFVQAVFASAYGVSLPRTAREQYRVSQRISRTELKEGDLLFFNTRGGVSHVGIYLQNNKFVHASTSQGVTVSDMFDPYYLKRFVGAGRAEDKTEGFSSSN
jgi:cell wall-associated NlpC family hydrolase